MYVCICVYLIYACVCVFLRTCICVCARKCTYTGLCVHEYVHTFYVCVSECMHVGVYEFMYTYMNMCILVLKRSICIRRRGTDLNLSRDIRHHV
jgi:hypothetical protein